MCIDDPTNYDTLINWSNKLDVSDSSLQIMEDRPMSKKDASPAVRRSIVVFFKSIGINTFNIIVMDLESRKFRFWYEGH